MSEETIWLVLGSSGEYSDRDEWQVVAFRAEADAQAKCDALSAAAREHEIAARAYFDRTAAARVSVLGSQWAYDSSRHAEIVAIAGPSPRWVDDVERCGDTYWIAPVMLHSTLSTKAQGETE